MNNEQLRVYGFLRSEGLLNESAPSFGEIQGGFERVKKAFCTSVQCTGKKRPSMIGVEKRQSQGDSCNDCGYALRWTVTKIKN